jgi:putative NADH-flavin reductase
MHLATRHVVYVILLLVSGLTSTSVRAITIVVYGASGPIGGLIVNEALSRGDRVIGVSRDPSKLKLENKNFNAVSGDVTDLASFKSITKGVDAVIISVGGVGKDNKPEHTSQAQAAQIAVQAFGGMAKSPHVIQIGGSTTMYETKEAMEAHLASAPSSVPYVIEPAKAREVAATLPRDTVPYAMVMGHLNELQTYRSSKIRWTVLTPPLKIEGHNIDAPPEPKRTGKYRTSTTGFVTDPNGESRANIADLAVAAVDEAEHPRFICKRFIIGY